MTVRIGLFGGAFNPIHLGHLLLAETAREALSLDRVVFIPTCQPPHKSPTQLLPGADRVALIEAAIRDHPAFVASDAELQRGGTSYTVDTVAAIRRQVPKARLYLLIGQDMLSVAWKDWAALKRSCTVVVARRPGSAGGRTQQGLTWLDMPQVDIASSDIRRRIRLGRSIRYLVPAAVERLIHQRGFYRAGGA